MVIYILQTDKRRSCELYNVSEARY